MAEQAPKKKKKRKGSSVRVEEMVADLTPMIDVVFLLMIFFIFSIKFKKLEGVLPTNLPKEFGKGGGAPLATPPLLLEIRAAGEIFDQPTGKFVAERVHLVFSGASLGTYMVTANDPLPAEGTMLKNYDRDTAIGELARLLEQKKKEIENLPDEDKPMIIIKPSPRIPMEDVTAVMDCLKGVGMTKISYASDITLEMYRALRSADGLK